MGYVIGVVLFVAIVLWVAFRRRPDDASGPSDTPGLATDPPEPPELLEQDEYLDSGFPVAVDQPDGPAPGERVLPDFQWPRILSVDIPATPQCGLTYPLIYTDLFQTLVRCEDVGRSSLAYHEQKLLTRAREQAAVYCYRHPSPDCRGVNEVSHSFSHQCFDADGSRYVGVTINYFFECSGAASGGGSTPPPVTEFPIPQGEPNCSSKYHFIAHSTSQILNDCNSPDRPAIEARKARDLLEAAEDHARGFCAGSPDESCRIPVALGHDISHHCFHSAPENAWFHTSTIIYFFMCPHTA